MTNCEKFITGINALQFSTEIKNSLLLLAYQELQQKSEIIKKKLFEIPYLKENKAQIAQLRQQQKEINEAMRSFRKTTKIDLNALVIEDPAVYVNALAEKGHNLHLLASIFSDAPVTIKQLQAQVYVKAISHLKKTQQEAQLRALSVEQIKDLIKQAVAYEEAFPELEVVTSPEKDLDFLLELNSLIYAANEVATSDPTHASEYPEFLFSLEAQFPNSSIVTNLILHEIKQIAAPDHVGLESFVMMNPLSVSRSSMIANDIQQDLEHEDIHIPEGTDLQSLVIVEATEPSLPNIIEKLFFQTIYWFVLNGKGIDRIFNSFMQTLQRGLFNLMSTKAPEEIEYLSITEKVEGYPPEVAPLFDDLTAVAKTVMRPVEGIETAPSSPLKHVPYIEARALDELQPLKERAPVASEEMAKESEVRLAAQVKKHRAAFLVEEENKKKEMQAAAKVEKNTKNVDFEHLYDQVETDEGLSADDTELDYDADFEDNDDFEEEIDLDHLYDDISEEATSSVKAKETLSPTTSVEDNALIEDLEGIKTAFTAFQNAILNSPENELTSERKEFDDAQAALKETRNLLSSLKRTAGVSPDDSKIDLDALLSESNDFSTETEDFDFKKLLAEEDFIGATVKSTQIDSQVLAEFLELVDLQTNDLANADPDQVLRIQQLITEMRQDQKLALDVDEKETLNLKYKELTETFRVLPAKLLIDLKEGKIDKELGQKLQKFFATQEKLGINTWKQGEIYQFADGTKFSFKNDVFQRARKDGKEGVRYETISKTLLGKGSFGEVKRIKRTVNLGTEGEDIKFKKFVKDEEGNQTRRRVVKIQHHEDFTSYSLSDYKKGFELAKRTVHLAIKEPTVEELSLDKQTSYTTMDEIPGQDLIDIISEDRNAQSRSDKQFLSTDQRIELTRLLLLNLQQQVSSKDIIHGDIKPENIKVVLGPPMKAYILDYDGGTAISDEDRRVSYTLGYHAPELLTEPDAVSIAIDVYSMARVIFLIWRGSSNTYKAVDNEGKRYYKPETFTDADLLAGIFTDIDDLTDHEKDVIEGTLLNMFTKEPENRYTAEEAIASFASIYNPPVVKAETSVGNEAASQAINTSSLADEVGQDTEVKANEPLVSDTLSMMLVEKFTRDIAALSKYREPLKVKACEQFIENFKAISRNAEDLLVVVEQDKEYEIAANKSFALLASLMDVCYEFFYDSTIDANQFKEKCDLIIANAKPVLEAHSDFPTLFADMAHLSDSLSKVEITNTVDKQVVTTKSFRFFNHKAAAEKQDALTDELSCQVTRLHCCSPVP